MSLDTLVLHSVGTDRPFLVCSPGQAGEQTQCFQRVLEGPPQDSYAQLGRSNKLLITAPVTVDLRWEFHGEELWRWQPGNC